MMCVIFMFTVISMMAAVVVIARLLIEVCWLAVVGVSIIGPQIKARITCFLVVYGLYL